MSNSDDEDKADRANDSAPVVAAISVSARRPAPEVVGLPF
jgi:hypothetical protein